MTASRALQRGEHSFRDGDRDALWVGVGRCRKRIRDDRNGYVLIFCEPDVWAQGRCAAAKAVAPLESILGCAAD